MYPRLAGSQTLASPILSHHRSAGSHFTAMSDFLWGFELAFLNELFLLDQEHLLCSIYSKPKAPGCGVMGCTGRQWELWAQVWMGATCCRCTPGPCLLTNIELVMYQGEGLSVTSRAHLKGKAWWYVTVTPARGRQRLGISHHSLAESGSSVQSETVSAERDQ